MSAFSHKRKTVWALLILLTSSMQAATCFAAEEAPAAAAVVPSTEVSRRHEIFRNERLTAYLLDIPPGHATQMHRHDTDMLSVFITGGRTISTLYGKPPKQDAFKPGDVRFRATGFTHATQNDDAANFRAVILEFARRQGQVVIESIPDQHYCNPDSASECVDEKPVLCTAKFCVKDVTVGAGAVRRGFAVDADQILIAVTGYSLSEEVIGERGALHTRNSSEVEWLTPDMPNRWKNTGPELARFIVVSFLEARVQ